MKTIYIPQYKIGDRVLFKKRIQGSKKVTYGVSEITRVLGNNDSDEFNPIEWNYYANDGVWFKESEIINKV